MLELVEMFISISMSLLGMFLVILAVSYMITSNIIDCNLDEIKEDDMDEEHEENINEELIYLISQPSDIKAAMPKYNIMDS